MSLSILRNGSASTLEIVSNIHKFLPTAAVALSQDFKITPLFDQSLLVKAAIEGMIREMLIAAYLMTTMTPLLLGNQRSVAIIVVSIPPSILSSIVALRLIGEAISLMTLDGLALAVGILVDDATVTIENIERHLHEGKEPVTAILDGAAEAAVPAFVSTLYAHIVFIPMFFSTGMTRYLFIPMAEVTILAVLASYVLSRMLVPTLVMMLMTSHTQDAQHADTKPSTFGRIYRAFNTQFERTHGNYAAILDGLLGYHRVFAPSSLDSRATSCALYLVLGCDFFPDVNAGQVRLHMRAPSGLWIKETAWLADEVEMATHEIIPKRELSTILDNLGVSNLGINLLYSSAGTIDTLDEEVLIALHEGERKPSTKYIRHLREVLSKRFPGAGFIFRPAGTVNQILSFGLLSTINVQFSGTDVATNQQPAGTLTNRIKQIPEAVDTHVHQHFDRPALVLNMDCTHIQQVGLEGRDVAQNLLVSLSSSSQTLPTFWLNPINGVTYQAVVTSPQYRVDSLDALLRALVTSSRGGAAQADGSQLLGNLVQVSLVAQPQAVSHYDITPAMDVYTVVQGRNLDAAAKEVQEAVDDIHPKLPRGAQVTVRDQVNTTESSFLDLDVGLVVATVLVYPLIVVNSQSWVDPLIIAIALPAALAGVAWMLFLTGTTLSMPSLTGAIVTMDVATANPILLISFACERLTESIAPVRAALKIGATRLRPVLMTALAMIIGTVPTVLGFGEGAEQNAPLGRAVIGGLLFAIISTPFFAPVVFTNAHNRLQQHTIRRSQDLRGNEGHV